MPSSAATHVEQLPTRVVIAAARELNRQFLAAEAVAAAATTATGVIYDGATANDPKAPAIRIGSAVFLPDERLAVEVNARYARIASDVVATAAALEAMGEDGSNRKGYKRVADAVRRAGDIQVDGYSVRFRLTYTASEVQGQVSVTHVKVTATHDSNPNHVMPVWFVNLKGAFAADVFMPYG